MPTGNAQTEFTGELRHRRPAHARRIHALALIKKAAARVNATWRTAAEVARLIEQAADEVLAGRHDEHFPGGLADRQRHPDQHERQRGDRWLRQRTAGIRVAASRRASQRPRQPRAEFNDSFPTAMHIAAAKAVQNNCRRPSPSFGGLTVEWHARRWHRTLMDATPTPSARNSAFVVQLDTRRVKAGCRRLPVVSGGTADWALAQARRRVAITPSPRKSPPNRACPSMYAEQVRRPGPATSRWSSSPRHLKKSLAVALMKDRQDLRLFGRPTRGLRRGEARPTSWAFDHAPARSTRPVRGAVDAGLPGQGNDSTRFPSPPTIW